MILRIVQIFIIWLLIASLLHILFRKLKLAYTVGLVLAGLGLAVLIPLIHGRSILVSPEQIRGVLVPELILTIFLPPLIFEATLHVPFADLRKELGKVFLLAIPGVVLTMVLVGGLLAWRSPLSLPVALVFGALISATDPVSVVALFKSMGVPKRLMLLVEGESLFNDGTAIVLFHMMLAVVASGEIHLLRSLIDFFRVAGGGVLVGLAIGWVVVLLIRKLEDELTIISFSIIAAYGSYLLAEHFHLSGVLAVVSAGLIFGSVLQEHQQSKGKLVSLWEYVAFLANTFVFLLIGLMVNITVLGHNFGYIVLAVLAVIIARAIVIYALSWLNKGIEPAYQHVLLWGGLRGAVALALALGLPLEELADGATVLQAMTFGVVLFTILVQGTTMAPLLKKLKIVGYADEI